ncbi:hypothetical protein G9A89_019344 [Geosiphon pyriformis]|nr:hypothetical protein G9A89_019344 [Geosiphon pyriformis]
MFFSELDITASVFSYIIGFSIIIGFIILAYYITFSSKEKNNHDGITKNHLDYGCLFLSIVGGMIWILSEYEKTLDLDDISLSWLPLRFSCSSLAQFVFGFPLWFSATFVPLLDSYFTLIRKTIITSFPLHSFYLILLNLFPGVLTLIFLNITQKTCEKSNLSLIIKDECCHSSSWTLAYVILITYYGILYFYLLGKLWKSQKKIMEFKLWIVQGFAGILVGMAHMIIFIMEKYYQNPHIAKNSISETTNVLTIMDAAFISIVPIFFRLMFGTYTCCNKTTPDRSYHYGDGDELQDSDLEADEMGDIENSIKYSKEIPTTITKKDYKNISQTNFQNETHIEVTQDKFTEFPSSNPPSYSKCSTSHTNRPRPRSWAYRGNVNEPTGAAGTFTRTTVTTSVERRFSMPVMLSETNQLLTKGDGERSDYGAIQIPNILQMESLYESFDDLLSRDLENEIEAKENKEGKSPSTNGKNPTCGANVYAAVPIEAFNLAQGFLNYGVKFNACIASKNDPIKAYLYVDGKNDNRYHEFFEPEPVIRGGFRSSDRRKFYTFHFARIFRNSGLENHFIYSGNGGVGAVSVYFYQAVKNKINNEGMGYFDLKQAGIEETNGYIHDGVEITTIFQEEPIEVFTHNTGISTLDTVDEDRPLAVLHLNYRLESWINRKNLHKSFIPGQAPICVPLINQVEMGLGTISQNKTPTNIGTFENPIEIESDSSGSDEVEEIYPQYKSEPTRHITCQLIAPNEVMRNISGSNSNEGLTYVKSQSHQSHHTLFNKPKLLELTPLVRQLPASSKNKARKNNSRQIGQDEGRLIPVTGPLSTVITEIRHSQVAAKNFRQSKTQSPEHINLRTSKAYQIRENQLEGGITNTKGSELKIQSNQFVSSQEKFAPNSLTNLTTSYPQDFSPQRGVILDNTHSFLRYAQSPQTIPERHKATFFDNIDPYNTKKFISQTNIPQISLPANNNHQEPRIPLNSQPSLPKGRKSFPLEPKSNQSTNLLNSMRPEGSQNLPPISNYDESINLYLESDVETSSDSSDSSVESAGKNNEGVVAMGE